jgi:hypothetical protein
VYLIRLRHAREKKSSIRHAAATLLAEIFLLWKICLCNSTSVVTFG